MYGIDMHVCIRPYFTTTSKITMKNANCRGEEKKTEALMYIELFLVLVKTSILMKIKNLKNHYTIEL